MIMKIYQIFQIWYIYILYQLATLPRNGFVLGWLRPTWPTAASQ